MQGTVLGSKNIKKSNKFIGSSCQRRIRSLGSGRKAQACDRGGSPGRQTPRVTGSKCFSTCYILTPGDLWTERAPGRSLCEDNYKASSQVAPWLTLGVFSSVSMYFSSSDHWMCITSTWMVLILSREGLKQIVLLSLHPNPEWSTSSDTAVHDGGRGRSRWCVVKSGQERTGGTLGSEIGLQGA